MFEHIVEQERVTDFLKNAVLKQQISHAYLFTGPAGIGKKTLARSFAEILRCTAGFDHRPCGKCAACKMMASGQSIDVLTIEPEAGSRTIKIRQIREAIAKISEKTYDGNMRVCFIFGAELMTVEAQNALLKSLEEPAEQNVFLLTSERPEKVLPTIRSRCQIFSLDPLSDAGIMTVLEKHGGEGELTEIISECGGNPGKAIEMMTDASIKAFIDDAFLQLSDILKGNPMPIFAFSEAMGNQKDKAGIVINDWLRGFEALLRAEKTGRMSEHSRWKTIMSLCKVGETEKILEILLTLSQRLGSNVNARLQWEAALFKIYRRHEIRDC